MHRQSTCSIIPHLPLLLDGVLFSPVHHAEAMYQFCIVKCTWSQVKPVQCVIHGSIKIILISFSFLSPNLILHSRILINRKIHFDASPPQKVSKAATHMALCPPNKGKHHAVTKPVIYIQSTSSFSQNFENLIIVHFPLNF